MLLGVHCSVCAVSLVAEIPPQPLLHLILVVFLTLYCARTVIRSLYTGEPGKGVKTIIEMVQSTRLDCILGSAGAARRALQIALNHAVSVTYHCPDVPGEATVVVRSYIVR